MSDDRQERFAPSRLKGNSEDVYLARNSHAAGGEVYALRSINE